MEDIDAEVRGWVLGGHSRSLKVRVAPEVFSRLPSVEIVEDQAT